MISSTGILKSGAVSATHITPTIIVTDNSNSNSNITNNGGNNSNTLSHRRSLTVSPSVQFSDQVTPNNNEPPGDSQGWIRSLMTRWFSPYTVPLNRFRKRTFKKVHSRPMLIGICALVVIECVCVLSELMVDLHGIKLRFENEAEEINKFVAHFRKKHPEAFQAVELRRMKDFMHLLKTSSTHSSLNRSINHMCNPLDRTVFRHERFSHTYPATPDYTRNLTTRVPLSVSTLSSAHNALNNNNAVLEHAQKVKTDIQGEKTSLTKNNQMKGQPFTQDKTVDSVNILLDTTTRILGSYNSTTSIPHLAHQGSTPHSLIVDTNSGITPTELSASNNNVVTYPPPRNTGTNSNNHIDAIEVPMHHSITSSGDETLNYVTTHVSRNISGSDYHVVQNELEKLHTNTTNVNQNDMDVSKTKDTLNYDISKNNDSQNLITKPTAALQTKNVNRMINSKPNFNTAFLTTKQRFKRQMKLNASFREKQLGHHIDNLFVLAINNVKENFFLIAELLPEHVKNNGSRQSKYKEEYKNVYRTSKALHYTSLSILGIMVLEVFDAIIVISSFCLDVMFLDSRWYETGKDATALLVLLLPWRVVRIVNSFVMTIKHKHQIQMMNLKRGKKKAELKTAKVQALLNEIRKDVELLVGLCKSVNVDEGSINACLYGKGRNGGVTQTVMESCASLMLISTLGKNPKPKEDDIYGTLIQEALDDGGTSFKSPEKKKEEEEAIDAAIALDDKLEARRKSSKRKSSLSIRLKKALLTRSHTIPRRCASLEIPATEDGMEANGEDGVGNNVFYIHQETGDMVPDGDYVIIDGSGHYYIRDIILPEEDGGSQDPSHVYYNCKTSSEL